MAASNPMGLLTECQVFLDRFESYLANYFSGIEKNAPHSAVSELMEAMRYSVFSGGKRFRPLLTLLNADMFGGDAGVEKALPFALAVECVHTYSLIHDDLPAMDNDDYRRGRLSNHKVFGEALALLAGDALLTEAFSIIGQSYQGETASGLVSRLSSAIGWRGMVGGQAIDLRLALRGRASWEELKLTHELKTGALIRVCVEGAAVICGIPAAEFARMERFGSILGLAFQLADDLEDAQGGEASGVPANMGIGKTEDFLKEATSEACGCLNPYGDRARHLKALTRFNIERTGLSGPAM